MVDVDPDVCDEAGGDRHLGQIGADLGQTKRAKNAARDSVRMEPGIRGKRARFVAGEGHSRAV